MHDVMDRHGRPSLGKLARLQYDVGLMYEATKNVDVAGAHYLIARNVSDASLPSCFMSSFPFSLSYRVAFSFAVLYCIFCLRCCLYYSLTLLHASFLTVLFYTLVVCFLLLV